MDIIKMLFQEEIKIIIQIGIIKVIQFKINRFKILAVKMSVNTFQIDKHGLDKINFMVLAKITILKHIKIKMELLIDKLKMNKRGIGKTKNLVQDKSKILELVKIIIMKLTGDNFQAGKHCLSSQVNIQV